MKPTLKSLARVAPILAILVAPGVAVAAPDPSVNLTLERPSAGFQTPIAPGDVLGWHIAVDNLGDTTATNVVLRAAIPGGMAFMVGSLFNIDPATMTVAYSSDNGATFGYMPVGAPGALDSAITDVRITIPSLGANPAGTATFATASSFDAGTHTSTWFEPGVGLRVSGGSASGTWQSPVFPADGISPVVAWSNLLIDDNTTPGIADVLYDLIDPATGNAIPGFAGLRPTNGVLDISTLSSSAYPQIAVRAVMTADTSASCFTEVRDQNLPDDPCTPDLLGLTNTNVVHGNLWRNGAACREKPFRWTLADGMTVLQSLADDTVAAYGYAMNDAGLLVGESMTSDLATTHAVVWAAGSSVPVDIHGSMGTGVSSWATDINATGVIVGMRGGVAAGPFRGTAGTLVTYDGQPGASWDWRPRIGADGTVAGRYRPEGAETWHAYRWASDGTFLDLGAPGDVFVVTAIGPGGSVAGYGVPNQDGWVWTAATGLVVLGDGFAGGGQFVANAIGPTGTVYGSFVNTSGFRRPFMWTAAGGIVELGSGTWANGEALDTNGAGEYFIVGYDPNAPNPPFARVGFGSGASINWLPSPGQIPEVLGQRLVHEGYSTFNDSRNVIGYYRTEQIVAGAPAEVPYFAGDCGEVAPLVASLQARWESANGFVVGFDAAYEADGCSNDDLATVTVNATADANTSNNMAFDVLRLARPDVGVDVTSNVGVLSIGGWNLIEWTVTATNYGVEAAPVQVVLQLPSNSIDQGATGGLDTQDGGSQVLGVVTLAPGEVRTFVWQSSHYTETSGLAIVATATIDTATDCIAANNTGSAAVTTGTGPNLHVTTQAAPQAVTGTSFDTQVVFGNNGTEAFTNGATLVVSLGGMPIDAINLDGGPFVVDFTPGDTAVTITVDTAATGEVPVGTSWILTLSATAPVCAANASGSLTTTAVWSATAGGPLDANATDDVDSGATTLYGDNGTDPSICPTACTTVADCPVQDAACEGSVACIANVGCVYNSFDLGFDADENGCTSNERCLNGALAFDAVTCEPQCDAAIGASCNPSTGQCQDILPAGSGGDTDGDGVADICDSCASDYYDCTGDRSAVYAIVNGPSGQPVGSIRCFHTGTGALDCDTVDGNVLVVYPDLVCNP